ncbi:MAG: DUF5115 domain-containing protein [Bacteroidales bacterium]|nr:DUF5115 domain-containing protein [Bacteroidales bacterium]
MNSKYLFTMVLGAAALAACTDDYKDWVDPQSNAQEPTVSFGDGSVTAVDTIDFRTLDTTYVKVCDITAPTSSDESYSPEYVITLSTADNLIDEESFDLSADGYMLASDLQGYLESSYGKRPVGREILAALSVWATSDGASVVLTSQTFKIVAIPEAPNVEGQYYLTGNFNGWDNTNTDFLLSNGNLDPYENPVYTCTFAIPAEKVADCVNGLEFKITPASGIGGDWSECLAAAETDGKFNYGNNGGNFTMPYNADAKYYTVSFNMLDQEWEGKSLNFAEYFYEIGGESGWSTPHALRSPGFDGIYKGYYYLDSEFKFKPNADNWDNDLENNGGNTLNESGIGNCPAPEAAGFYEITLDLTTMTYSLTALNIGLVGGFNNWGGDGDPALTYDATSGSFKATAIELPKGDVKFRANADWAINWGGGTVSTDGDVITATGMTQDGGNITLAAGIYDIELTLSYEGNHKAVFTKTGGSASQWSEFIYYAGESNGWSATASPLADKGSGKYQGFYYVNGGFKIVDGSWYGDDGAGKIAAGDGHDNITGITEGFYQMDVDMSALTYTFTPVTNISIIGSATGDDTWSTDLDMTWNATDRVWEYTGALVAGEFKFRLNHEWTISWGGTSLDALTSNGGDNLSIGAEGTYKITFAPNCDDKGVATVTAQ